MKARLTGVVSAGGYGLLFTGFSCSPARHQRRFEMLRRGEGQRNNRVSKRGHLCGLSGVQSVCAIRCETCSLHPIALRASSQWGPTLGADTGDCAVCVIEGLSLGSSPHFLASIVSRNFLGEDVSIASETGSPAYSPHFKKTVEPTRRTHHAFDVYPETFD